MEYREEGGVVESGAETAGSEDYAAAVGEGEEMGYGVEDLGGWGGEGEGSEKVEAGGV